MTKEDVCPEEEKTAQSGPAMASGFPNPNPHGQESVFCSPSAIFGYHSGQFEEASEECWLKHFRRIATHYDKLARSLLAAIALASTRLWIRHYESTTWWGKNDVSNVTE